MPARRARREERDPPHAARLSGVPELPEVETVRRQLAPHVVGRTISALHIADERWCAPQHPEALEQAIVGQQITALGRRGKHLIVELSGGAQLLVHLRMTGILLWEAAPDVPYERVRFWLDGEHPLAFCDPRRFGTGMLLPDAATRDAYLDARLGPEPLDPESFTAQVLREAFRGREAPVKGVLLDQRTVAGVGNIYADEALFRAGIHPRDPLGWCAPISWSRCARGSSSRWSLGSMAVGRRSMIFGTSMARGDLSRTTSSCTVVAACPARTAGRRFRRWSSPGAAPTCARSASLRRAVCRAARAACLRAADRQAALAASVSRAPYARPSSSASLPDLSAAAVSV